MKKSIVSILAISASLLSASAFAEKVPNYTDNVQVNLLNFPSTVLDIHYNTDTNNATTINGPHHVDTAAGHYTFTVHSDNVVSNGFPSFDLTSADGTLNCHFAFVDGPWADFNYQTDKPQCQHLTVSDIYFDSQYHYHIDLTYKA